MTSSGTEAYKLGRDYTVMPIPIDPEHCVEIGAGPLVLIAESRWLSAERVRDHADALGQIDEIDEVDGLEDSGLSVHVIGADDRGEHLRFDCFENEPHYHYIYQRAQTNTVVRIDDVAEGDPLAWMLRTLRARLPEMLEHVGLPELATLVRADIATVQVAIDELERVVARIGADGSTIGGAPT